MSIVNTESVENGIAMSVSIDGVVSLKVNGVEINIRKTQHQDTISSAFKTDIDDIENTANEIVSNKRKSRGEPYLYMDREKKVLRRGYQDEKAGRETMVTKSEFDLIVKELDKSITPQGKIKISHSSFKKLEINGAKISAVKQLLSGADIISSAKGARACYCNGNRSNFISRAVTVWSDPDLESGVINRAK